MKVRTLLAIVAVGTCFALPACTRQQVYESGTAFRIQECERIADPARRDECLALARKSYKEYEGMTREGAR